MLTTLSILSLDQGPKWRESEPEGARAPEVYPERLHDSPQALLAAFVAFFRGYRKTGCFALEPLTD